MCRSTGRELTSAPLKNWPGGSSFQEPVLLRRTQQAGSAMGLTEDCGRTLSDHRLCTQMQLAELRQATKQSPSAATKQEAGFRCKLKQ